ncbi:ATP-binding protein [Prosthecomicrobium sp. N25]|uniref:ATP-binding protein n=1 Tax=Prosthecomicrobium sp. N25 TaxID=3129254 RepID=UPI003077544A
MAVLEARVAKLEKINSVLIDRVERSMDSQGSAFSLFQTAIGLERQIRERTDELTRTLRKLERANDELTTARDLAEQANRSKTRFLAAAGHDLLQPVNAARLSISALAETRVGEEGGRLVRQIDRSLGTIETLLRTLLDMSKLDAGVMVPNLGAVAVAEVLSALESDFRPVALRKGLRLVIAPTSVFAVTDPVMLRRILQNLVSNAIRYTEAGGVLVGVRPRGADRLRIDVVDTGSGIPPERHEVIFEEFHRGGTAVGDGEIALGLGLSIVRRLVGALGHDLTLHSAVGRGTTFSLLLPRAEPVAPVALETLMARSLQGYGLSGALVAVVENDEAVREATTTLLERWSCRVVAGGSVAAVTAAGEAAGQAPDLILADYHLDEGRTGLDAIRALRSRFGRAIPAVVVTADYSDAVAGEVAAANAELMRKPVKPAELRALMAHILQ